ncbi:MAG TPA: hypothetical protein VFH78_15700 [Candidatus Thermoplasmatota archaeon]|nr:hypothetical protein [Candidatus Thermoplasmatota archaeon]
MGELTQNAEEVQIVDKVNDRKATVTPEGALKVDAGLPAEFPLPASQVAALTPPAHPAEYPLPASQVAALTPPAHPAEYPLPAAQLDALRPATKVYKVSVDLTAARATHTAVLSNKTIRRVKIYRNDGGHDVVQVGWGTSAPAADSDATLDLHNLVRPDTDWIISDARLAGHSLYVKNAALAAGSRLVLIVEADD